MDCRRTLVAAAVAAAAPVCAQPAAAAREALAPSKEPPSIVAAKANQPPQPPRMGLRWAASSPESFRRADKQDARSGNLPVPLQATISKRLGQDRSEYAGREQRAGARRSQQVHFANAAHGLAAQHDGDRLMVEVEGSGARWGLAWQRLGCRAAGEKETRWVRVGKATTQHIEANQAEWVRLAGRARVREWAVNGPVGLQHGFTLEEAPGLCAGGSGAEEVVMELGTRGARKSLRMEVEAAKRGVVVKRQGGGEAVLRYGGLFAYDGKGRELEAWMEVGEGERLRLHVQVAGARYPVVIDPFVQQAKLTASDGAAFDSLGFSVAISGDTVVVGAPEDDIGANGDQGAAYVFVKPSGGWGSETPVQVRLSASDGAAADRFGRSVAINGDTVVVGAPHHDVVSGLNTIDNQGAAYVFLKPAGGWGSATPAQVKLTASDGMANDRFGWSVATTANTVAVGAAFANVGLNGAQGAAYVFVKPDAGWGSATPVEAKLTASDGAAFDNFGWSVAAAGDSVVAGAPFKTGNNGTSQGAVYVFVRPTSGWGSAMPTQAKLRAHDGLAFDELGTSVAISGDTVVAGAPFATIGNSSESGAAYVFVKPTGGWANTIQVAKLKASDSAAFDQLGWSVAISGDTVIAGAPFRDVASGAMTNADQGAAYIFQRPGTGWTANMTETGKLTASDGVANDNFGFSVALAEGTLVVGVPAANVAVNDDQGSAYVSVEVPATPTITATTSTTATETATPTPSETATHTPSPTSTGTDIPSPTSSPSSSATATVSPTGTPSPAATATVSATASSSPTLTVSATATATPTPSSTATSTPTPTATPSSTATSSPTPVDTDGDGVPDAVEEGCASGTSTEANTTALPAASGGGCVIVESDCDQHSAVAAFSANQVGNDGNFSYPFGLVGFTLEGCPNGTAQVRLTFTAATDLSLLTFRKFGPLPPGASNAVFYTLGQENPNANVTMSGNTISFQLQDGQPGDDTGVDGLIVDQGGPALPSPAAVPVWSALSRALAVLALVVVGIGSLLCSALRKLAPR